MRVAFLTHYFPPEVGAPQTRMFELARRLQAAGDEVTVVTAFPNYPTGVVHEGYRRHLAMEERMDGVRVLRRWVFATPNAGFLKRIVNHFSFVVSSLFALRALGPVDVIFVQSPPLPIGIAALVFSRIKRAPFVFNVSDVWPQSAVELGALRNPLAIRLAEMLESRVYRRAARITVPTHGIFDTLAGRGIPVAKLCLLTNGVDVDLYRPRTPDGALARRLGVEDRSVFLYAGTHGLSQGLDVILEAAKLTRDPRVLYVLVGEGADKAALVEKAEEEEIANVRLLPNQPKTLVPALLNLAYAAVVPLKPLEVFRSAIPSKVYEAMATGRPVVASLWGEAADVVWRSGCGLVTQPGDPAALAAAVQELAAEPEEARRMGERGRGYVVEHFNRATIAASLRRLLDDCVRESRRPTERAARALDLAIAVPALVLAAPLIALAALAVKLETPGPALYHGLRVGRRGSTFQMHKLRTMRAGRAGPEVTAGDDARITRVGRMLRRTKLDELPQLANVVAGEMSLVGPRPEHPDYVRLYTERQRRLLELRPGITGPATLAYIDEEEQLRGGDAEARYVHSVMPRKLRLELEHLDDMSSFAARTKILLRTAGAILRRPFASSRDGHGRSRSQPE